MGSGGVARLLLVTSNNDGQQCWHGHLAGHGVRASTVRNRGLCMTVQVGLLLRNVKFEGGWLLGSILI